MIICVYNNNKSKNSKKLFLPNENDAIATIENAHNCMKTQLIPTIQNTKIHKSTTIIRTQII